MSMYTVHIYVYIYIYYVYRYVCVSVCCMRCSIFSHVCCTRAQDAGLPGRSGAHADPADVEGQVADEVEILGAWWNCLAKKTSENW